MKRITLQIEGVHQAYSARIVEKALKSLGGVSSASINLPLGRADVNHLSETRISDMIGIVRDIGYKAEELAEERERYVDKP